MSGSPGFEWQIGVFCQNERPRIRACLSSIVRAAGSRRVRVTVIVNGSSDGSAEAARAAAQELPLPIEVYRIAQGDKANAINRFIYDLRVGAALYFCVDGYVTVSPGSLEAMAARLAEHGGARVASGVALNGRTERSLALRTVEAGGVVRGQLYCMTRDFVERMVERGIRLPVGLYRGDGLLCSMAAHDLDATGEPWLDSRVLGVADAEYEIDALSALRLRDLRRQFRRKVRQTRGLVENAAIREIIYAGGYPALPDFADDMIRGYLAEHPPPRVSLPDRVFMALALRQHRAATRPDAEALRPHRVDGAAA